MDAPNAVLIRHKEWGIYLGSMLGLGFWSKLDPAGQTAAPVFETMQDAIDFIRTWDNQPVSSAVDFIAVTPDQGFYISREACAAQGVGSWDEDQETSNGRA